MIIKFLEKESNNITLKRVSRKPLSEHYLRDREHVWKDKLDDTRKAGKQLWNGKVYTIETIRQFDNDDILIELGSCEYKDIVFKAEIRALNLVERYGSEHLPNNISVNCLPLSYDNHFIFGIRGGDYECTVRTVGNGWRIT